MRPFRLFCSVSVTNKNCLSSVLYFYSPGCGVQFTSGVGKELFLTIAAVKKSVPFICLFFFFKINGAGVEELMKQLPNCRGHWCVESYKLARSCGKLPFTSIETLPFLNSSSRQEKKQFESAKRKC